MPGKVVSQEEWLEARLALLAQEKAHNKAAEDLTTARAALPMTKVTKPYTFTGADGPVSLLDMFRGKKQLLLHAIMFDPSWDKACNGCSFALDDTPLHLDHLYSKETMYAVVARAPYEKIDAFCKQKMGWPFPFYSSFGSDFNYDFDTTIDESVQPTRYNYNTKAEFEKMGMTKGEVPGLFVFFRDGEDVYHTYTAFDNDHLGMTFKLLDLTPLGRQSPHPGLPYRYTYGTKVEGEKSCH